MRQEIIKAVCLSIECSKNGCVDVGATGIPDLVKYTKTRDHGLLKFRGGAHPTIFHVGEVPHVNWSWVMSATSEEEKAERSFRCAVKKVENVLQSDGVRVGDWSPVTDERGGVMTEDQARLFSPAERLEIGVVAFTHSFLARRIDDCFHLHALSQEALERTMYLHADASQAGVAETSSDKPSPKSDSSPLPGVTANDSATVGATSD